MPGLYEKFAENFQLFVGSLFAIGAFGYIWSIMIQWAIGNVGWKIYSVAQTGVMLVFAVFFIWTGMKQKKAAKEIGPMPSAEEIDRIAKELRG